MKTLNAVAALAVALSLSACATVTRGTKQQFYIMSEPDGAAVTMTNGQTCTTPCQMKLKRKTEFELTVSKDGYKSITVPIESSVRGGGAVGVAGNVIVGGGIGIVIDATNGSMNDLRPNPLKVVLAGNESADASKVVPTQKPKRTKSASK